MLPAFAALIAFPNSCASSAMPRFGVLALAWTTNRLLRSLRSRHRSRRHSLRSRIAWKGESEIGAVVWGSLAMLVPLGLVGFAVLFVAAPWLTGVLKVPQALHTETITSFRILAAAIPFAGATAAFRGVLEARQLFGAINALRAPQSPDVPRARPRRSPFHTASGRRHDPHPVRVSLCIAHYVVCARMVPQWRSRNSAGAGALGPLLTFAGDDGLELVSPSRTRSPRFVVGAAITSPS